MKDILAPQKTDAILLAGNADVKIDIMALNLLDYFEHYEYFPQAYFSRQNISIDTFISENIKDNQRIIVNTLPQDSFSELVKDSVFKVLIVFSTADEREYPIKVYDYIVDARDISEDVLVQRIVVAWGCWLDGRKITSPM